MNEESKTVSYSAINDHSIPVMPGDLNHNNTAFGGLVLSTLDHITGTVASRHSEKTCVTRVVDSIEFHVPAVQGEILVFKASLNRAWGTSMEVGAKVFADNLLDGTRKHLVSAYFTFVAVDKNGAPTPVRPVIPETPDEIRRFKEAGDRRARRLEYSKKK